MRCTTGRPSLRGRAPGSPSRSTSRSSTTDGACTRPWATAPHTTRSPTTELRRPPQRDQPEDLSKILDTAHHNQVDELLVAAAVKVLTGTRRWRAASEDLLPQFWQEVGPERDHRDQQDPLTAVMRLLGED